MSLLQHDGRHAEALAHGQSLAARLSRRGAVLDLAELLLASDAAAAARATLIRHGDRLKQTTRFYLLQAGISHAMGDGDAADWLAQGCKAFPDDTALHSTHWAVLARDGQADAAIAACLAFSPAGMTKAAIHLLRAKFLSRLNARAAFEAEVAQARASGVGKDALATEVLIARDLFANGHVADAADLLDEMPFSTVGKARIQVLRAQLDAAQGEIQAALARLEMLAANPEALLLMARLYSDTGAFDAAEALLARLPGRLNAKNAVLEIRILKETGRHAEAEAAAVQAARGQGATHPAVWHALSDIQAINGRIEDAWQSHQRRITLSRAKDLAGRNSSKALQTFWGQILNEYRLNTSPKDRTHRAPDSDSRAALRHFRRRMVAEPDNIAAAMGLMTILRRRGAISANPPQNRLRGAEKIPRRIAQFWDAADPVPEIAALSAHNAEINPGWDYRLFNDETARQFLLDHGERTALVAYTQTPLAAAKADIFRIACLYHRGGVYLDADDKCLTGLDTFLDPCLTFTACQEDLTSIGNNFIACAPKHPILSHALNLACSARNNTTGESVWLALGPGLLTRAIASAGTTRDGMFRQGIWIMPAHRLNRHVKTAMPLGYKSTAAHWVRDLATRRK
ncbi:MAG: tetratricopeptide repeat protein [Rhodobacteraceae bacterium]|nr:tetratricopeptide repeat protein [Paracoccaceae bacterium]